MELVSLMLFTRISHIILFTQTTLISDAIFEQALTNILMLKIAIFKIRNEK